MAKKRKTTKPKYTKKQLESLIRKATAHCDGDDQQFMVLTTIIGDSLATPFETEVLGITVTVESIENVRRREVVAICRSGEHHQAISLADLPIPSPPPEGAEWIAAYRHWASTF